MYIVGQTFKVKHFDPWIFSHWGRSTDRHIWPPLWLWLLWPLPQAPHSALVIESLNSILLSVQPDVFFNFSGAQGAVCWTTICTPNPSFPSSNSSPPPPPTHKCFLSSLYFVFFQLWFNVLFLLHNRIIVRIWVSFFPLSLIYLLQALTLPPISKWPTQSGFTFSTWLRVEKPFDSQRDYYKPVVYWLVLSLTKSA